MPDELHADLHAAGLQSGVLGRGWQGSGSDTEEPKNYTADATWAYQLKV